LCKEKEQQKKTKREKGHGGNEKRKEKKTTFTERKGNQTKECVGSRRIEVEGWRGRKGAKQLWQLKSLRVTMDPAPKY
jgi:hypothetical protein